MIIPKIGDEVWVAYRARGKSPPQKGVVSQIFDFEDRKTREMKTMVVVYRIARGQIGEKIFFSEDEAWEAYLKEMKRRGRLPLTRKEVEGVPRRYENVEVSHGHFVQIGAVAREVIEKIIKEKDYLSIGEAQAIKLLCDFYEVSMNYYHTSVRQKKQEQTPAECCDSYSQEETQ